MRNFAEMVWLGELIEHGNKTKKLNVLKSPIGTKPIEEDGETEVIFQNSNIEAMPYTRPIHHIIP